MTDHLPEDHIVKTPQTSVLRRGISYLRQLLNQQTEKSWSKITLLLAICCLGLIIGNSVLPQGKKVISPLLSGSLKPLGADSQRQYEVFGFAPFWTLHKLDNVDFDTLSTLAYFGVPVMGDGSLDTEDIGYKRFHSKQATKLFMKAHAHNTRVVLTITQMKNEEIEALLDSDEAQEIAITNVVSEVKKRGIDGINIDFEYVGNPGYLYRQKYSRFVQKLSKRMHEVVPSSRVSVSVYASAAKSPKLYDIASLSDSTDGIFMMAYDFSVASSEVAAPTAPLHGYKEGKYAYDIATAVKDFLRYMPADKLILGVPYYGYNYPVKSTQVNASTYPGDRATQTYELATRNVNATVKSEEQYKEGWDSIGKVGWRAYKSEKTNTWRMLFLDDQRSLSIKYDFAKENNLAGVGMWALGFDEGRPELWNLLRIKFGPKLADSAISGRTIREGI